MLSDHGDAEDEDDDEDDEADEEDGEEDEDKVGEDGGDTRTMTTRMMTTMTTTTTTKTRTTRTVMMTMTTLSTRCVVEVHIKVVRWVGKALSALSLTLLLLGVRNWVAFEEVLGVWLFPVTQDLADDPASARSNLKLAFVPRPPQGAMP